MPTAKKLPSGSWRCQVFSHIEEITQEDGSIKKKRIYKSFTYDGDTTAKGKRKCEAMAAEWAAHKETLSKNSSLTFGEAMDNYIEERKNILSPRSIADYKRIRKKDIQGIMNVKIDDITQDLIQKIVNQDAIKHSPKTVRDNHGLIAAVLKRYRPEFALNTVLPKRIRPELYIPSDSDIRILLTAVRDTDMELPVYLAAFGPMRRGEICALRNCNINGNIVHVCENMVLDENKKWIIKTPKSYAGDRYIEFPDFVAAKWRGLSGRVMPLTPDAVSNRFARILKNAGIHHFRFHDLRHYCASVQHAMGIPDAYIMERGGWGNDGVLKSVYRHAMEEQNKYMNAKTNTYFEELCNTKCNTKKINP